MIRAVIVDDETFASDSLSKLLSIYCTEVAVIGKAHSVDHAINVLQELQPELVFLDIHLAQDTSFSILKHFPEIPFSIIFTSAHTNYGIEAFKVNAIDYLLKPVDADDLINAVEKYSRWRALNEHVNAANATIRIHDRNLVNILNVSDIVSLVANDNYTTIFTIPDQKHTTAKTLKEMEETLKAHPNFIRIHHGVIINTRFVDTYSKVQPYTISMSNGLSYEMSRRKRAEVITMLK